MQATEDQVVEEIVEADDDEVINQSLISNQVLCTFYSSDVAKNTNYNVLTLSSLSMSVSFKFTHKHKITPYNIVCLVNILSPVKP